MTPVWYLRRLRRMSPAEAAQRGAAVARQWWWSAEARRPDLLATLLPSPPIAPFALTRAAAPQGPAAAAVLEAAEALLAGEWRLFSHAAVPVPAEPDWCRDPLTGRQSPPVYCFDVPYRDEAAVGNIKFVWELSRHQPATLLACAWWISGDERFAARAAALLCSWWRDNPFLQGVQWISAIEAGLRLLSWSWMRALLADWRPAARLFERNDVFVAQLYAHCRFIAAFPSAGSSANNHLIAEQAGLHAAACCFPLFAESATWRARSGAALSREAEAQTHPDGWNKEQASGYHLFVAEMLLAAALPARALGQRLGRVERAVCRMIDALAASLDGAGQPPRFGDCDDARGVLLDAPGHAPAAALLDAGRALWGGSDWWPPASGSVVGHVAGAIAGAAPPARRLPRTEQFPAAGIAILRSGDLWLRCDDGPHGFRSIAAHGHADALSLELRLGGVEILADPGTYCYHGEPAWRGYFRGTAGHNTLRVGGADQARPGGPFLWLSLPRSTREAWEPGRLWQARHNGYRAGAHHRRVTLSGRTVRIADWLDAAGPQAVELHFHFGQEVGVRLLAGGAVLHWRERAAGMALPRALRWTLHRGEQDPPLGWYSRSFGHRMPAFTLRGRGTLSRGHTLETVLNLPEFGHA